MRMAVRSRSKGLDEFDFLVESRGVGVAFQPIVELGSRDVVGFEALARTPNGSSFPDPGALFAEAYRRGRVGELDWVCRAAALRAALAAKLPRELPVFINVEPAAISAPCPADLLGVFATAIHHCELVVEVTERSVASDPAELLAAVDRARELSVGIALDDVGADPASLTLMPLIAPDVIKLDLRLIQSRPNPEIARIVNAVLAESERTGALILAEGVESERHVAVARAMGATLGQGWLFGRAAPLPDDLPVPARPLRLPSPVKERADTPFIMASRVRSPVASNRDLLAATSHHLENEVLDTSGKAVLLSSFEVAANFTPGIRRRYERLAQHTVLAGVLGQDMLTHPGLGLRGGDLDSDDPLCREWTVIVLGSQLAAALIAHRIDNSLPTGAGQFAAIITHDRDLVVAAARSVLSRLPGLG
jgi:EAL domain-containing protein (putative c-di-GMP-specific phosphodiesterase class I)